MKEFISKSKKFFWDLFFPKFCFSCKKEGNYLCEDCLAMLEILESQFCPNCQKRVMDEKTCPNCKKFTKLNGLYFAAPYQNHLIKKMITNFKLEKKRLKWRGFNQSEEIGKELVEFLKIPLLNDVLYKIRETLPQIELTAEARIKNIKGVFWVKNQEKIKERKILLVDDVYTTGSTMNECARVLKESGAKEVWGVVIARE